MQEVQRSTDEISSMFDLANRMARRYGRIGTLEPEDIAQNAMLKLLNRREDRPPTAGWLFMTVRSVAYDAYRVRSRERRYMADLDYGDEDKNPTKCVCESADESGYVRLRSTYIRTREEQEADVSSQLADVLQRLTAPLRDVLMLYAEGFSYQQIAQKTKTKIGTVRSRLYHARKYAQQMLAELN